MTFRLLLGSFAKERGEERPQPPEDEMKRSRYRSLVLLALLSSPGITEPLIDSHLQGELRELQIRGYTVQYLDKDLIEIRNESLGFARVKSLREPTAAEIYAWADTEGVPILEVDPALIDTSIYSGWYLFFNELPVSNGSQPLVISDTDENDLLEAYGVFKDYLGDYKSRIYELGQDGQSTFRYEYVPRRGPSIQFSDVDHDSFHEISFWLGDSIYLYEQPSADSLPTRADFSYAMWRYPGTGLWTNVHIANLDGDSLVDFLYRGSDVDTTEPSGFRYGTYVAEYDPVRNVFGDVWSTELSSYGESGVGGYDVGDYDGDGFVEFLASSWRGNVWVVENVGDNSFWLVWQDSLPFSNVYYQTSGDVDDDGKSEFVVGGTTSDGNWTAVYEADSNNSLSPKFLFHLLSGGVLAEPTYMTRDVDGDGQSELIIASGVDIFVFRGRGDNTYELWYYRREESLVEALQVIDVNGDDRLDFVLGRIEINNLGQFRMYCDIYIASEAVDVTEGTNYQIRGESHLDQNFPNPFNPRTNIAYNLDLGGFVELKVFNVLGQEVTTLVSGEQKVGMHTITFDATGLPSGFYIYQLKAPHSKKARRMVMIK